MSENQELQNCPYCDNQGFFVEGERHPIYDSDESGYPVLVGFHETAVQVQCEFCWTNPLSVFNATNKACTRLLLQSRRPKSNPQPATAGNANR